MTGGKRQVHCARASDLRDVLLCLVELLSEVLCRCLAGDLDKGHLFAITCQIARCLTHAVVIVSLHEEVWGVRQREGKGTRTILITEALWLSCNERWRGSCTRYVISYLPNAGSAHSLYCSGVQYGASPTEKCHENQLWTEKSQDFNGRFSIVNFQKA